MGFFLLNSFKLNVINHGIEGVENTLFVLFRKLCNIIEPLHHRRTCSLKCINSSFHSGGKYNFGPEGVSPGANRNFDAGSFSIFNWDGYPIGGIKPTGPFRLLEGAEYTTARNLANKTNAALHRTNPQLKGLQIHEVHPVKFGGSPTSMSNKLFLTPQQHRLYNTFWFKIQKTTK